MLMLSLEKLYLSVLWILHPPTCCILLMTLSFLFGEIFIVIIVIANWNGGTQRGVALLSIFGTPVKKLVRRDWCTRGGKSFKRSRRHK